jgi:hypothetical protein
METTLVLYQLTVVIIAYYSNARCEINATNSAIYGSGSSTSVDGLGRSGFTNIGKYRYL